MDSSNPPKSQAVALPEPFIPPSEWLAKVPVHAHVGTFADLATRRLPELQRVLELQIANPIPLSLFAADNTGAATLSTDATILTHLEAVSDAHFAARKHTAALREKAGKRASKHEFAGVYVFIAEKRPFYVGITRTVFRRVQSHVRKPTHNTASLFFSMVCRATKHKGSRGALSLKSERAKSIQKWLQSQSVAILPLACPVERYAFELYAAMVLQTGLWNTFETH